MEAQGKRRSILRDLALIYISLAHSTDQDLSEAEVEMISQRLRAWQTDATEETVLSAIKDALEDYTHERAREGVERAVRRIRDELDPEMRKVIVADLTDIALADDKFLHTEGSFIGELARAWDVRLSDDDNPAQSWSILNGDGNASGSGNENGWSAVHDLALIYLEIAHGADDEIVESEVNAIASKIHEWMPDADESEILKVVRDAMHAYVQGPDKRLFEDSVETLKRVVPQHQRAALLADLNYVARADGKITDKERAMIERLTKAWNVELSETE